MLILISDLREVEEVDGVAGTVLCCGGETALLQCPALRAARKETKIALSERNRKFPVTRAEAKCPREEFEAINSTKSQ
jgi:hypothetical protein